MSATPGLMMGISSHLTSGDEQTSGYVVLNSNGGLVSSSSGVPSSSYAMMNHNHGTFHAHHNSLNTNSAVNHNPQQIINNPHTNCYNQQPQHLMQHNNNQPMLMLKLDQHTLDHPKGMGQL